MLKYGGTFVALMMAATALADTVSDCQKGSDDPDLAIKACSWIIKQGPVADAYFYRASAYLTKRDYQKSLADYDKAIELAPHQGLLLRSRQRQ